MPDHLKAWVGAAYLAILVGTVNRWGWDAGLVALGAMTWVEVTIAKLLVGIASALDAYLKAKRP